MRRFPWWALVPLIPVIFVVGAVLVSNAVVEARRQPSQPIDFPHNLHVSSFRLECTFCHRGAEIGIQATIPAVEQCMFCHSVAGQSAEVQKLRGYWERQEEIRWTKVHRLPDTVQFVHEPHIRANVACQTCHGKVEEMRVARQERPLNMGDCVNCHRENAAPTECQVCHY